jgi:hypothetical protein
MASKPKINDGNYLAHIGALREYYRENFVNGESDEAFLIWISGDLPPSSDEED